MPQKMWPLKNVTCHIFAFSDAPRIRGGEQIDKSIHETVSPYVLFSDPEKNRGLSWKTTEERDFEKESKIGTLVTNHGTKRMFLEFMKNSQ